MTEDSATLRRWMIAGPEVSRLVAGYEAASGLRGEEHNIRDHEQTPSAQKSFFKK